MNKRGQVAFYLFMIFIVFIILALALSKPLTDNSDEVKNQLGQKRALNETYTLDNCLVNGSEFLQVNTSNSNCNITVANNEGTVTESCPLVNVIVRNITNQTLVSNTDYILNSAIGVIALQNTSSFNYNDSGNITFFDYTYCPLGYINCSTTTNYQDKAFCTQEDSFPWFFIGIVIALALIIISAIGRGQ